MRRIVGIIIVLILATLSSRGQTDSCWTALLVKKGRMLTIRDKMAVADDNGFYLYRNCVYDIKLTSGKKYNARLIDIKKDTLTFLSSFNESVAKKEGQPLDTLNLNYKSLEKIFLIADRTMGYFTHISLDNYDVTFSLDTSHCELPIEKRNIFQGDSVQYELVPFLTHQGLNWLFEIDGKTYYYTGVMPKPVPPVIDTVYRTVKFSFIPAFDSDVDEIKGVAFGFIAWPADDDSLKVQGLCIELLPVGSFPPLFGSFLSRDSALFAGPPDSTVVIIKGVDLSAGGAFGPTEITGFYIGGVSTIVNKLDGFSLTGVHTIAHEMKGFSISGLRNQSRRARGVQIALFNSSLDFRGIQFGLWNKNQRRSLPFVNWNFKKV